LETYQHTLPVREKIAYGLGDTATNLVWRTLMVFLPFFYTDVFGLSAAAVGTLLLVSRYGDGISDFLMGILADRCNSRWGKFRPWILWTAVPFGVLTVLTFTTPDLGPTGKLVYAYLTYNALLLVFTANNVPYSALTGVISHSPAERTILTSYRFFFAFFGAILVQGLNTPLVQFFGKGDDVVGYRWTMTFFAVLAVILFIITFLNTKERVPTPKREKLELKEDLKDLFKNRAWLILFCVGLSFVTLTTLKQGVTMYYFSYYIGNISLSAVFLVLSTLGAMAGAVAAGPLSVRFGKQPVLTWSFALAAVSSAALYLARPDDIILIFVLGILTEFSTGPIVVLFFAMLADAADYSEWKNHRRATGLVYSAGTLSIKFGTGIGGALTGWTLMVVGYAANVEQTPEALTGIRLLISIFPAVAAILGLIAFRFYPIDDDLLETIKNTLKARHEATNA
jgi:GPH family glycoside/pentoside/hexuronide:cation symporter